jgi:hypothetical protein
MKSTSEKPPGKQKAAKSEADRAKNGAKGPESRVVEPEANAKDLAPESSDERLQRDLKELAPQLSATIKQAVHRWGERHLRLGATFSTADGAARTLSLKPDFGGRVGFQFREMDAFGTTSTEFASRSLGWLAAVARRQGSSLPTQQELNAALAVVDGVRPENEIEAMLAMQMFAAHEAAMEAMERLRQSSSREAMESYGAVATKMMRTYTTQVEALAKLRRGGNQTVRVEHVHVHAGGQAIVGAVTHPQQGGGGTQENLGQPHEADTRAVVFAPGSPMWSGDPERYAMSEGSPEGEDQV